MAYNTTAAPPSSSYEENQGHPQGVNTYAPNPSSYETGPANTLDPHVDSNLNNRAQYAPDTTTATNTHPGVASHASNPAASNIGPYESGINNELDPRVDSQTGGMMTNTTGGNFGNRQSTAAPTAAATSTPHGGVVGGSSTGAPALPSRSSRPEYSREHSSYNPATGTGYTPRRQSEEAAPVQQTGAAASGSKGDGIGQAIKGTLAGIHGAGESIRGTVNATIDRTFNESEGVEKNEAIRREGENEVRSGQFSSTTKQREGFGTGSRRA